MCDALFVSFSPYILNWPPLTYWTDFPTELPCPFELTALDLLSWPSLTYGVDRPWPTLTAPYKFIEQFQHVVDLDGGTRRVMSRLVCPSLSGRRVLFGLGHCGHHADTSNALFGKAQFTCDLKTFVRNLPVSLERYLATVTRGISGFLCCVHGTYICVPFWLIIMQCWLNLLDDTLVAHIGLIK